MDIQDKIERLEHRVNSLEVQLNTFKHEFRERSILTESYDYTRCTVIFIMSLIILEVIAYYHPFRIF